MQKITPGRELWLSWGRASQSIAEQPSCYRPALKTLAKVRERPARDQSTVPGPRVPRHIQCGSGWAPVGLSLWRNRSTPLGWASWRYTAPSQIAPTQRALPSPMALFMTQSGGKKNLSTQSKQLISLPGCLGSSNVIIIPTKALVSVRLISTTAADTIIKVPGFLCSKSYTDEAHKVCFGGETKHGIFFFFSQLLSFLLPSLQRSGRGCQNVLHAAANRPRPMGVVTVATACSQVARSLVMRQE